MHESNRAGRSRSRGTWTAALAGLWLLGASAGAAHAGLDIGSRNTAVADPPVTRPATQPCEVTLFADQVFADFNVKPFTFTPPAACPGPWAKVVLEADFSVTAGRQFDRTATIFFGGTNIYFGTTSEPSRNVSRSWHIERDLTDYTALFTAPTTGQVELGNLVDSTFTSLLFGSATLQFYPLARAQAAPPSADLVLPLAAGANGGTVALASSDAALARSFTLPHNVERAFLDVFAQSQMNDEFWYLCVPNDVAAELQSCGNTGFREAEVAIDGSPAGVAPVYPWIFTGGIDPFLWAPIPGVQTLAFEPYRVDLTPFAGLLSDGRAHEVAVRVFNAADHFSVTAALLLYLDHGASEVTGEVTSNTLAAAPTPVIQEQLGPRAADGSVSGTVTVSAHREHVIAGVVNSSHGKVRTEVVQSIDFSNQQRFDIDNTAGKFVQALKQRTNIATFTRTHGHGAPVVSSVAATWPLDLSFAFVPAADGSATQTTTVHQAIERSLSVTGGGHFSDASVLSNMVDTSNTRNFDTTGAFTGNTAQASSQAYFTVDARGDCFSRKLTTAAGVLTAVVDGDGCGR